MLHRIPIHIDLPITVVGGTGSVSKILQGKIIRARITPPGPGDFRLHVEDEVDILFAIPDDNAVLNDTSVVRISDGELTGPTTFFITESTVDGAFNIRIWGYFYVVL